MPFIMSIKIEKFSGEIECCLLVYLIVVLNGWSCNDCFMDRFCYHFGLLTCLTFEIVLSYITKLIFWKFIDVSFCALKYLKLLAAAEISLEGWLDCHFEGPVWRANYINFCHYFN